MKNLAKGRKHSKEVKETMSINRKGDKNSFFNKNHSLETLSLMRTIALNRKKSSKPGFEVEIKNIENNTITVFSSIRKAANSMNSNIKTILILTCQRRQRQRSCFGREKLEKEK